MIEIDLYAYDVTNVYACDVPYTLPKLSVSQKDACFPKFINIPNLHSDDREVTIIENINF